MHAFRRSMAAVRGLFRRRRLEMELDEKLRFHLAMEAEAQVRRGSSRAEAERRAMLNLGGLEATKEAARSARAYRRQVAAAACLLPARRATAVQPSLALRAP